MTPAARRATAYAVSKRFPRSGGAWRVKVNSSGRNSLTPSVFAPILLEWLMNFEREAPSFNDALGSAMHDIEKAGGCILRIE